jgi:hypothetical protein
MVSIISEQRRKELLAQAPKRQDFPDEESYEEAKAGYRHRVGPLLRQYAASQATPASPKAKP